MHLVHLDLGIFSAVTAIKTEYWNKPDIEWDFQISVPQSVEPEFSKINKLSWWEQNGVFIKWSTIKISSKHCSFIFIIFLLLIAL
jgi:hypothetical protein